VEFEIDSVKGGSMVARGRVIQMSDGMRARDGVRRVRSSMKMAENVVAHAIGVPQGQISRVVFAAGVSGETRGTLC
jgi:hypothetical protein